MSEQPYKHAASVTGQAFFCAAPIRFDSYDSCQFGCSYCFSRKRSRLWSNKGTHAASAGAFNQRMTRIAGGKVASALDEFLAARVPLQLGGLHDPFTPRERKDGVTLAVLKVLRDKFYPTLISTKGELVAEEPYVSILREMNVLVRFSASGICEEARAKVDRGCSSFDRTLDKIRLLARLGVTTALRIQPVIPGFETDALLMTERAASAGARQVSFEYLKLPTETSVSVARSLEAATGMDILGLMRSWGATRLGWDYVLPPNAKRGFIREARRTCHAKGVRFGAGDTEFIPWSDGDGCCGSSSVFLKSAKQFESNLVGVIKAAVGKVSHSVSFDDVQKRWSPTLPVSTYLSTRSRVFDNDGTRSDWVSLMAARWNGQSGPYSPDYFDGVTWSGKVDRKGFRIYDASNLAKALS
jgi:DNA repair photolyase